MHQRESPRYIEAKRLVLNFPDAPSRTLAKRLAEEMHCTIEQARNSIRNVRGTLGKAKAKNAVVTVTKGKSGWRPQMPPSVAEEWEPYKLEASRIGSLSDIHIPYHCEVALSSAVAECKKRNADAILLNGDALDFYSISRWQKDPRKRNFKQEIESAKQFFEWLRHEFPKARIVFKVGNHEERWNAYLWNHAPEICDLPQVQLAEILELQNQGIELVDEERPVMCGKLPCFHGHELPKGLTNPVNMARGAFLRLCDTVLVGHGHRSSTHTEPNWEHNETTTWSQGCLCNMSPKHARINKWNHGFAFVEVASDGDFDLSNYRINSDGKVRKS